MEMTIDLWKLKAQAKRLYPNLHQRKQWLEKTVWLIKNNKHVLYGKAGTAWGKSSCSAN